VELWTLVLKINTVEDLESIIVFIYSLTCAVDKQSYLQRGIEVHAELVYIYIYVQIAYCLEYALLELLS